MSPPARLCSFSCPSGTAAQGRISHSAGGDSGCIDSGRCVDLNVDLIVAGNDNTHDNKNLELGQPC